LLRTPQKGTFQTNVDISGDETENQTIAISRFLANAIGDTDMKLLDVWDGSASNLDGASYF